MKYFKIIFYWKWNESICYSSELRQVKQNSDGSLEQIHTDVYRIILIINTIFLNWNWNWIGTLLHISHIGKNDRSWVVLILMIFSIFRWIFMRSFWISFSYFFFLRCLHEICVRVAIYAEAPTVYFSLEMNAKAFVSAAPAPSSAAMNNKKKINE